MKYLVFLLIPFLACNNEQKPDLTYDTSVANPAYAVEHPRVMFDEAHNNFHTADGRYKPFANLIRNDGYIVEQNKKQFTKESLAGYSVLVISNAKGKVEKYLSAFDEEECDIVRDWVENGGSLLLIADHYPMGSAAQPLATRFDVMMGNGSVEDSMHFEGSPQWKDQLVFSRANKLLKSHPITEGRNSSEKIQKVVVFTGQSLNGPADAQVLLELSSSAMETIPDSIWKADGKTYTRFQGPYPIQDKCMGLAMNFGKGRVVVLGEAACMTAQSDDTGKFGMNVPGNDNRQFALNVMRWLSGLY
ncbi:DUF4350 domain-containing protein [bacterium]|nr:DUF4350 domain-containing protein [bacterium]